MPALKDLEQLRYWQGQLLQSRDFRDQQAINEQKRCWHVRAAHGVFGVSRGLKVRGVLSGASLEVTVDCGLAYDCFGHELVLQTPRKAPVLPDGAGPWTLVLTYLTPAPHPGPLERNLKLSWLPGSQVRIGDGVPLASATLTGAVPALDPAFTPPIARAMARPRLASGDTVGKYAVGGVDRQRGCRRWIRFSSYRRGSNLRRYVCRWIHGYSRILRDPAMA